MGFLYKLYRDLTSPIFSASQIYESYTSWDKTTNSVISVIGQKMKKAVHLKL